MWGPPDNDPVTWRCAPIGWPGRCSLSPSYRDKNHPIRSRTPVQTSAAPLSKPCSRACPSATPPPFSRSIQSRMHFLSGRARSATSLVTSADRPSRAVSSRSLGTMQLAAPFLSIAIHRVSSSAVVSPHCLMPCSRSQVLDVRTNSLVRATKQRRPQSSTPPPLVGEHATFLPRVPFAAEPHNRAPPGCGPTPPCRWRSDAAAPVGCYALARVVVGRVTLCSGLRRYCASRLRRSCSSRRWIWPVWPLFLLQFLK
jgi:hypothetical protein